jgi:tRNA A37 methylthiotransferase MiaB
LRRLRLSSKEQKRILLINPPYYRLYKKTYSADRYPLSLGYLAVAIRKRTDWDVMVYNADFVPNSDLGFSVKFVLGEGFRNYLKNLKDLSYLAWKEVGQTLAEYSPDAVGIYSCASSFASVSTVARMVKERNRQAVVIVGGPHPSAAPDLVLKDPNVDVAVRGEGENTIVDLVKAIDEDASFDKIEGTAVRINDHVVNAPKRAEIADLDSLGFPYELAPEVLKDYRKYSKSAFRYVYTTRGCLSNCFFCGSKYIWGKKLRYRSVQHVVDEIKLLKMMGLKWITFGDDTFGVDKDYTRSLCDSIIHNCQGILWGCETRADLVDEEILVLMKKAGCRSIAVGVESGNNEMLRTIRKGITVEQALSAIKLVRKHGIKVIAFFIIGFPEETRKTLEDTFKLMKKIDGLIVYNIFTPYPGTEAFTLCEEAGLVDGCYDMSVFNHQSPENCFCKNINKGEFREMASKIETYVDLHNAQQDLKEVLSLSSLSKIHDYGFRKSVVKFVSSVQNLFS